MISLSNPFVKPLKVLLRDTANLLALITIDKGLHLQVILRDKTMADKLLYTPNDDTQKYPFCRLQLVVETF